MEQFETIKRARSILSAAPESKASKKTAAGYEVEVRRLFRQAKARACTVLDVAKNTESCNTWFRKRAALKYWVRSSLATLLAVQDKEQRELRVSGADLAGEAAHGWRESIRQIGKFADFLERIEAERPPAKRKPRHSKRKDMRSLPDDWRERMVSRMQKYRHAVLVQAVTGCRPEELERGVKLSIRDRLLVVEIEGAKVTATSGQPWRRLSWLIDSDSRLVNMLAEEVRNGLTLVKIESAKTYSGAVIAAGKREWPLRQKSVSPYCFRHAFASDMKLVGMGDDDISKALGHCSDVARSYYGQWQQGTGAMAPDRVEAARAVRMKKSHRERPSHGMSEELHFGI